MPILTRDEVFTGLTKLNTQRRYKAMYSSLFGGIVTDPALMLLPIDEHMVHRGDGVFEALRVTPTQIYLLKPHLERLQSSAMCLGLNLRWSIDEIASLCEEVRAVARASASGFENGILRIFIGRGPGDFSPNPYSTIGSQIYIVATDYQPLPADKYKTGASMALSQVPIKPTFYSRVKSCNYLQNVMMKKEAIDRGVDFVVNLNAHDFLAEGPTENMMIVNRHGHLVAPKFDYTLSGTTLIRAKWFAKNKMNLNTEFQDISVDDLTCAREVMMVGTTLGVLPVTQVSGQPVSDGKVGPVALRLHEYIEKDQNSNLHE
jgi:4-amino-4-deoxychorismate lyase